MGGGDAAGLQGKQPVVLLLPLGQAGSTVASSTSCTTLFVPPTPSPAVVCFHVGTSLGWSTVAGHGWGSIQ